MHKQLIRVIYPTDGARIALRTEDDWDTNIEAMGQNGRAVAGIGDSNRSNDSRTVCAWEFLIETERPYFYFKPVLLREDGALQCRPVAVAVSAAREICFSSVQIVYTMPGISGIALSVFSEMPA